MNCILASSVELRVLVHLQLDSQWFCAARTYEPRCLNSNSIERNPSPLASRSHSVRCAIHIYTRTCASCKPICFVHGLVQWIFFVSFHIYLVRAPAGIRCCQITHFIRHAYPIRTSPPSRLLGGFPHLCAGEGNYVGCNGGPVFLLPVCCDGG